MAKTFYTERDIEDLASQGVNSLVIDTNVVLTDLARDKARLLGVELLKESDSRLSSAPNRPYLSAQPTPTKELPNEKLSPDPGVELEERVHAAVKSRLGDQVDNTLLRTIVQRVIKSIKGE